MGHSSLQQVLGLESVDATPIFFRSPRFVWVEAFDLALGLEGIFEHVFDVLGDNAFRETV